jgi:hypothetical protein
LYRRSANSILTRLATHTLTRTHATDAKESNDEEEERDATTPILLMVGLGVGFLTVLMLGGRATEATPTTTDRKVAHGDADEDDDTTTEEDSDAGSTGM